MKKNYLLLMLFVMLIPLAFAQTTTVNGLAVVVRYNDYKINATNAQISAMLNQETGFNLWGNATSVKQFYKVQSDNKLILNSHVIDVQLTQNSSFYHGPNLPYDGGQVLVADVVAAINAKYPTGFTGLTLQATEDRLMHFTIISQSAPTEGAGVAYSVPVQYIKNNGVDMPIRNVGLISYRYTNDYEVNVMCHEYGHSVFGWTDYYRTADSNLGDYCVMASAGILSAPMPLNPALRYQKGWIGDVVNIGSTTTTYTITSNSYSQVHKYTNPNNPKEYLLINAIKHGGYYPATLDNGKPLDQGLAIWYVDEDGAFDIAGVEKQYRIRLVQADNLDEMHDEFIPNSADVRGDLNDFYDNISNSFPNGTPFRWKDGGEFGLSITNISAPGNTMSFTVNARPNTVIASSDLNGTLSPKGTLSVPSGQNRVFTFTPNAGYEIDAILVNGVAVATSNPYTMTGISGTQTIKATFKKKTTIDAVPSPWVHTNIGTSTLTGFGTHSSGKLSIESYGNDLNQGGDNFGYIFQTLNGDGSIVAKVASSNTPSWGNKVGVMARETLFPNSVFSMISKAPSNGACAQQRTSIGGSIKNDPDNKENLHIYSLHQWVRIVRSGNTFTNSVSRDGINWVVISQQVISMGPSIYVGVFTTGGLSSYPAKATFESITVTTANPSPTVSITSPANNSSYVGGTNIVINATAADANGTVTKVDFYIDNQFVGTDNSSPYSFTWTNSHVGKHIITAKATDNQSAVTTSVPVTINAPCVFTEAKLTGTVIGSTGSWGNYGNTREKAFDGDINSYFDAETDIAWTGLTLSTNYIVKGIKYFPRGEGLAGRMVGGKFQGSNTADFSSGVVDLVTITEVPAYEWNCFTITNPTAFRYLRYLCPADGYGNVAEIEFYGTTNGNTAPTVSITSPITNTSFNAPATINFTANAADVDGTVTKVEFFNGSNTTPIGTDFSSPYQFTWSGVTAGTYSITAKATDNSGAVTTSTAITVIVTSPNTPPTVSITSPVNNATYNAPASINLTANASDVDGTISKVEFLNGSTVINTDNASPFEFTWSVATAGTYTITAKAYDNSTGITTSTAITITVNSVGGCSAPQYVQNGGYIAGSRVKNNGVQYECKPYPFTGWCNGASWAYAPGTGTYWADAWIQIGTCSAKEASSAVDFATDANSLSGADELVLYPNPARDVLNLNNCKNIRIINAQGELVKEFAEETVINLQGFTRGFYILQAEHNGKQINKKFQVEY